MKILRRIKYTVKVIHGSVNLITGAISRSEIDQILVTLQYWREYRPYFHIAHDWGVSESTISRIVKKVENVLIQSEQFRLAGKKALWAEPEIAKIAVDVTESRIERPKHGQKHFYSGKKKYHTLALLNQAMNQ